MNGTRGSSFLDPDTVVIHPTNWQAIRTAKDTHGQYYGGGPFYGPYGGPQGPAGASQFSADKLWGMRVVVTSAITVGTALVGAFCEGRRSSAGRADGRGDQQHGTYFATTSRRSGPSAARARGLSGRAHSRAVTGMAS